MNRYYTSIEESKKLIELGLKPETADMWYRSLLDFPEIKRTINGELGILPCWSVGQLLELMPTYELWKENRDNTIKYCIVHSWYQSDWYDTVIEAIIDMIEQLH